MKTFEVQISLNGRKITIEQEATTPAEAIRTIKDGNPIARIIRCNEVNEADLSLCLN